jgi:hypothetical protein
VTGGRGTGGRPARDRPGDDRAAHGPRARGRPAAGQPVRGVPAGDQPAPDRRPGRLRWTGLAGTGLLAVGGYLAGADPGPAPAGQAEALWGTDGWFRLGLLACLLGLLALAGAWWRLGDALRGAAPPGVRWVLVTGALWAAPLLVAPPLGSRDVYAYACQGAAWLDGYDPYAVGAADAGCRWLAAVPSLWHDTTAPYGPVALVASAAAVGLARLLAAGGPEQLLVAIGGLRAVAVLGALLVAAAGPRLARTCGVDPAAAAWLGLVTPLVALHVVAGAHNDALVAGLVVAGLALAGLARAARSGPAPGDRPGLDDAPGLGDGPGLDDGPAPAEASGTGVAAGAAARPDRAVTRAAGAGVALGLAVAVKVTAAAALPFALLLAGRGARRDGGVLAAAAVAGFAGPTLATGLGTGWLRALPDTGALAQWSSPPTGLGMAVGYVLRALGAPEAYDDAVGVARAVGLVALVVVTAALLWRAWRRAADPAAVVAGGGAVLAAVVLLGPVVYPWYAVTPLAVLAAAVRDPRVRRWLAVATLGLTALVLPSGLGVPVLTKFPGAMLTAAAAVVAGGWWLRRWRRRRAVRPGPPVPETPAPTGAGRAAPTDRTGRPGQPDPPDPPRSGPSMPDP